MFPVKEDTLTDMVDAMKEDIGLVHQMPYTCDGAGLPSTLEKVKVNRRQCNVFWFFLDLILTWQYDYRLLITSTWVLSISILYRHTDILKISMITRHQWELKGLVLREKKSCFLHLSVISNQTRLPYTDWLTQHKLQHNWLDWTVYKRSFEIWLSHCQSVNTKYILIWAQQTNISNIQYSV